MKKLTGMLCAFTLLILASSFTAKADTVSAKVQTAFEKAFVSASEVNWKKFNGFYLANFKLNNQDLSAAYNDEGELMSATRTITLRDLPLGVTLALQKRYANYTIEKFATELIVEGTSTYYLRGENAKNIVTIRANANGDLSTENKIRK